MPTYAHTTKAAGTVLAGGASGNYNTDHANHVTNQTPAQTDDYSVDVATMRTRTDPYPSGSESLATDLAGEVARLRYHLAVITDYLNGHAPDGTTTNAITAAGAANLAAIQWYNKIKNPQFRAVGCQVYNSAAVSHSTSGTRQAMTYDTESWDLDGAATGFHSTSSNTSRITVPTGLAGIYWITGACSFPANATGNVRMIGIRLNAGTTYYAISDPWYNGPTSSQIVESSVSALAKLAAADYVELITNQDSGAAMNISGPDAGGGTFVGPVFGATLVGYSV